VKAFCKRAESLDRIDILIANAGIATPKFELVEGFESTITVNVIATFLMIMLLVPKMKESREKFGTKARIVVVTSDAHHMSVVSLRTFYCLFWCKHRAKYQERSAPNVFHAFADPDAKGQDDRYPTSKLLEILVVHELAAQLASHTSSSPIIVNSVNPGYCKSELQRYAKPLRYVLVKIGGFFVARSTEVGSRTVFAGAMVEEETNGKYMSNCVVTEPVAWIDTEHGRKVGRKAWEDLAGVLEGIEPGIRASLQKERA
jgi:retinol dehydrogenase-12